MTALSGLRWALFTIYLCAILAVPALILWGPAGASVGIILGISFVIYLGGNGAERIAERLGAIPKTSAEVPKYHNWVKEYCRRLNIPTPRLAVLPTPTLQVATYGFSQKNATLVLSEGVLNSFKDEEISALIARQLVQISKGTFGASWLSQFLSVLDPWFTLNGKPQKKGGYYPLRLFVRQLILYPIAAIPIRLLAFQTPPQKLDQMTAALIGNPRPLAEALRLMESMKERHPYFVSFSLRHLFLVPPPSLDPLVRILFEDPYLTPRIERLEGFHRVVQMS